MQKDTIISLLTRAYAAELETMENYLAHSVWLDGLRAQEVVEALSKDLLDELGHARELAHRLKQLAPARLARCPCIATSMPFNRAPTRRTCGMSSSACWGPSAKRSRLIGS